MASHNPVKDRQDIPIWNAIEANNFKQALKLVDKRLAKRPTEYLQALKTFIRSQSPSIAEKAQVLIILEVLPTKKPPVTDLDAIDLYDEALESVLPEQQTSWGKVVGELRCHSVKASPKDEALSRKCLKACLSKGDLDHARQIAISLEKNFPNHHAYVFWNITLTFLYSKSTNCPEEQRGIFGKLALAQIGKLATATIEAGISNNLPTRSIHTPQELLLLHLVTAKYGTLEKQLDYLQDPYLGPESTIAKGEWSLWRDKLQLMKQARQWQDLFQVTSNLLARARAKDESGQLSESRYSDWAVWEAYVQSSLELSSNDKNVQVTAEIEAHLDPNSGVDKSWRRNASLAWLRLSFENSTPFESSMDPGKLQPLLTYLEKHGGATTAYNDLRPFAERLELEDRTQLVRILTSNSSFGDSEKFRNGKPQSRGWLCPEFEDFTTANNIISLINRYKLIYLVTSSLPERERLHSPLYRSGVSQFQCKGCYQSCGAYCETCLENLAYVTLRSYGKAINNDDIITNKLLPTDRHPADDLCILSAMCLVKLSFVDGDESIESLGDVKASYILQGTVLLEYAWSHSKPNFQISLLLVRLYSMLGCGSLAMRAFQRMGVKQIQLDTLSYTLFDRISSLHPHSFGRNIHGSAQFPSPIEHLESQQMLYRKSRDHVSRNCWTSLEHGNYNSIFQIKEFEERMTHSMSAVMAVVEARKIARLIQPNVQQITFPGGLDILNPGDRQAIFSDTNDYESSPSFEASTEVPFGKFLQFKRGPSAFRSHMNLVAEHLMLIIDPVSNESSATALLWLKHRPSDGSDKAHGSGVSSIPGGLTKCEGLSIQAHNIMADIILCVGDEERRSEPDLLRGIQALNEDLCETLEMQLAHVVKIENEALAVQGTLHALYTAYELGIMVMKFTAYLSRTKQDTYNTQEQANLKTNGIAESLLQAVFEKSTAIKKGLDESGWIDKILESVSHGEQASTDQPISIADTLKGIIDENFLEEWAGHVLESWRDSVVGFSNFKSAAKS